MAATGVTVVPAYRVVAHFEKQVRQYVRSSLSPLHGSYVEIGERWAVTQLGDPDLDSLAEAILLADKAGPKGVVEGALRCATHLLPRPDLSARCLLLPGDGASKLLTQVMMGVSLGSQATLLFFWPSGELLSWLGYTAVHEYAHLVRNHLLPRALAGGRPVYLKTQEPETLVDAIVSEDIADAFAQEVFPHMRPPWLQVLGEADLKGVWPKVRRRLRVSDPSEVRRFISGDGDRVPQWTGYNLGYRIVASYLERNPDTRPANLVGMQASTIFRDSEYGDASIEDGKDLRRD